MNEVIVMKKLYPLKELVRDHKNCLQGEPPLALSEEVLETQTQQVHHHRIIITFHAKPVHCWDSNYK
jgi:hypothetical protein